jgi:hypothetical protein
MSTTQIPVCPIINGVSGKKIYKINDEQFSLKKRSHTDNKTIIDFIRKINALFNLKINETIPDFNRKSNDIKRSIIENYDKKEKEIIQLFGENIKLDQYKFDIEQLINNDDIYLVSAGPALPDKLLDEGIHAFSTDYLFSGVPPNNTKISRLSIHSYTNDKVYSHGHGNWENFNYLIIIKLKDIKDNVLSIDWDDTVSLYGVDYKDKDIHIILPETDTSAKTRLQTWLNEENIHTYKPCEYRTDIKTYISIDKTICKTSRDMSNEVLNDIFIKFSKKLLKKSHDGDTNSSMKFLLYNPNNNNVECFINDINYDKLNAANGDGNLFEQEEDIKILKRITDNNFFGLHEAAHTNFTLNTEGMSKMDLLRPLFYIFSNEEQSTYDNTSKLIDNNKIMKSMYGKIKHSICTYLNIDIDFAYDLYILMSNFLINDDYRGTTIGNVNPIYKYSRVMILNGEYENIDDQEEKDIKKIKIDASFILINDLVEKINRVIEEGFSAEISKKTIIRDFKILFNNYLENYNYDEMGLCDPVFIDKIEVMFEKYESVSSRSKYLKYKTKYLNLKKSLNLK